MGRRITGPDVAMIVFGIIMLVMALSLYGVTAEMMSARNSWHLNWIEFIPGTWYLIVAILAIAAGGSGNRGCYIAVIVLSIFAILIALASTIVSVLLGYTDVFSEHALRNDVNNDVDNILNGDVSSIGGDFEDTVNDGANLVYSRVIGRTSTVVPALAPIIIHALTFILMIVLSSISCCGCCSVRPTPNPNLPNGSYLVLTNPAPGYVAQAPNVFGQSSLPSAHAPQPYSVQNAGYDQ